MYVHGHLTLPQADDADESDFMVQGASSEKKKGKEKKKEGQRERKREKYKERRRVSENYSGKNELETTEEYRVSEDATSCYPRRSRNNSSEFTEVKS